MSGKKIPMLLWEGSGAMLKRGSAPADAADAPLLGELLWRRRWTIGLAVGGCLFAALIYLLFAPRVYSAQSRLFIEQNGPRVFSDNQNNPAESDTYLYTQAQAIESMPVLHYALDQIGYRNLKTFSSTTGDPVDWLLRGSDFKVDVGKKDDIITVSMESPYAQEATDFVKAVVDSYLFRLSSHRRVTGEEMVKILSDEREQLGQKLETGIGALVQFKAVNGAVSFSDEKGNITLDRLSALSTALTAAELETLDARAQLAATSSVLSDPEKTAAYVESQQMKGRDFGDKEYDDLRSQLEQYQVMLRTDLQIIGPSNIRAREIQSSIDLLQTKIADKQKAIAQGQVAGLTVQLNAATDRENHIRASLEQQRQAALALNPLAAEYARLASDVERMQKQCDVLDSRIQEVSVNNLNAGALDVEVLDPAHADDKPIRPKKTLSLAIALLWGLLMGSGIVMLQEWRDKRLRTPEDITGLLELPVVGIVPQMPPALSRSQRGQLVHGDSMSEVAEAYRAIRTTIHFGAPSGSKTFLITSPTAGEGKSTCSSNLAIAFAQGGHRTLLIDGDLRRPMQHKFFQIDGGAGISDVMTGGARLRDAICPTGVDDLYLLPCGTLPGKPAEMLESRRFAEVMRTLSTVFDRIVIDSPPTIAVTDARILAASADVTILVLRMHRSSRKLAEVAVETLQKVKATVLGAIANEVQTADGYGYYGNLRPRISPRRQLLRKFGSAIGYEVRTANGNGHVNGNGNSNGSAARRPALSVDAAPLPAEIQTINDPDSPADARWAVSAER